MELVLQLAPRDAQIAFNRERWEGILEDPALAALPYKIETNRHGQVITTPPASGNHSTLQSRIILLIHRYLGGNPLPECPVSTIDGVRAADVGWYSDVRFAEVRGQAVFERAPEICVEIVSPRNSEAELVEKRTLYFEAESEEVWVCRENGSLEFYVKTYFTQGFRRLMLEY